LKHFLLHLVLDQIAEVGLELMKVLYARHIIVKAVKDAEEELTCNLLGQGDELIEVHIAFWIPLEKHIHDSIDLLMVSFNLFLDQRAAHMCLLIVKAK
jgi:hypothetical protein